MSDNLVHFIFYLPTQDSQVFQPSVVTLLTPVIFGQVLDIDEGVHLEFLRESEAVDYWVDFLSNDEGAYSLLQEFAAGAFYVHQA